MDFSQNEVSPVRRFGGLSIVVLLHALVAYALITGLARKMVDVIKEPIVTKIIEEVKAPPPKDVPPPPKLAPPPPPPFIPPPEVQIQAPQSQYAITATTSVQPPAQPLKKTVVVPPAPAIADRPVPAIADLNACKPVYPKASLMAEETGTVRVQFEIGADSQLVGVSIVKSSGFKNLDNATVNGLSHCKFKAAYKDGKAVQSSFTTEYVWKFDE